MPTQARPAIASLCLLAATLAACSHPDVQQQALADTAAGPAPNVVNVRATEYAFDMPDTIPAGLTTLHLVDAGQELHHVQLVKLDQGKTVNDLVKALQKGPGPLPSWATEEGGVNAPRPGGGEASTTLDIAPGSYAVVCFIPDANGVPHIMKGMTRPLTVTPSTGTAVAEPNADVTVTLTDYKFDLSTPITAGTHTLRIENAGQQPHEIQLVRLAPGKSAADMSVWIDRQMGPPPGEPIGGVPAIPVGAHAFVTENFQPGNYALLCFIPDVKDGKPHAVHGMVKQIRVAEATK
jgi:hypothetical protein